MVERFKEILRLFGISQKALAETVGIHPNSLTEFAKGRTKTLSQEVLVYLNTEFGVNLRWLTTGEGKPFDGHDDVKNPVSGELMAGLGKAERKIVEDLIAVLAKDSRPIAPAQPEAYSHSEVREIVELGSVAAGPLTSEEVIAGKKIQFPRALIPERGPLYALRVRGDSMIGANIHDGDYAIIRPVPQPQELKQGTIVVALVNGENTLKRLYRADHSATLRAANDRYPDIQVTSFHELVIQGELRYLLKKVGE